MSFGRANTKIEDFPTTSSGGSLWEAPPQTILSQGRQLGTNSANIDESAFSYQNATVNNEKLCGFFTSNQADRYDKLLNSVVWNPRLGARANFSSKISYLNFTGLDMIVQDPSGVVHVCGTMATDPRHAANMFPATNGGELIGKFVVITEYSFESCNKGEMLTRNNSSSGNSAQRLHKMLQDYDDYAHFRKHSTGEVVYVSKGNVKGEYQTQCVIGYVTMSPIQGEWEDDKVYYNTENGVSIWKFPKDGSVINRPSYLEACVSGAILKQNVADNGAGNAYMITTNVPSNSGLGYYLGAVGHCDPQVIASQYDRAMRPGLHMKNLKDGMWTFLGDDPTRVKGVAIFTSYNEAKVFMSAREHNENIGKILSNEDKVIENYNKVRDAEFKENNRREEMEYKNAARAAENRDRVKSSVRDGVLNFIKIIVLPIVSMGLALAGALFKQKYIDPMTPKKGFGLGKLSGGIDSSPFSTP